MGRVPGGRRRYLDRAVLVVADPRPLNGDFAEGGLEGEGTCPPALDAGTAFAMPLLQDQFLVGLLHEHLEEPALDFQTGLMNVGLESARGDARPGCGMGKDIPSVNSSENAWPSLLTGLTRDGSLKAVGGTHGMSPYWYDTMGVHPA